MKFRIKFRRSLVRFNESVSINFFLAPSKLVVRFKGENQYRHFLSQELKVGCSFRFRFYFIPLNIL